MLNLTYHARSGGWMLMPFASAAALIAMQPTSCTNTFWVQDLDQGSDLTALRTFTSSSVVIFPDIFGITELLVSFGLRLATNAAHVLFSDEALHFVRFMATVAAFEIAAATTFKDLSWPGIGRTRKLCRAQASILEYPRSQPIGRHVVLESLQMVRDGGVSPAMSGVDPAHAAPRLAPPRTPAACAAWAARHSPPAPPARPAAARRPC